MSDRPWSNPDGWELLLRRVRSDATYGGISSLLVACEITEGELSYDYMQHWLNGQLATWEPRESFEVDLVIRRQAAAEDEIWSSRAPAAAMADDRFRTPSSETWCSYPPTPFGFVSVDRSIDAVVTVRVRVASKAGVTYELALFRAEDGSWAEWRSAPGEQLELPSENLTIGLDDYSWTRLALGRCSLAAIFDRVELAGDAMMLGALQSGLATARNLNASVAVWPAVRLYEEYLDTMRFLDTAELRLVV
jgi:hypothetical protein